MTQCLHLSTTLLFLSRDKIDVTHLINRNRNRCVLIFILSEKKIGQKYCLVLQQQTNIFDNFCQRNFLCVSTITTSKTELFIFKV